MACFQHFIRVKAMSQVIGGMVLKLLSWLVDSINRVLDMINACYTSMLDPLHFSINITVPLRVLKLLQRGTCASRPQARLSHVV